MEKSCACARVSLPKGEVPAGSHATVELEWQPKPDQLEEPAAGAVRIWATVRFGAGGSPLRLEAVGQLSPAVEWNLPRGRLDFGRLDLADLQKASRTLSIEIFSRRTLPEPLVQAIRSSSSGLRVEPLQPLTADRHSELRATAGVRVTITAGPGLPVGRFSERLELQTAAYPFPLEVRVEGSVESGAVSLEPAQFEVASSRLSIGKGFRSPPLRVRLRQEPGRKLQVKRIEPPIFSAELTPTGPNEWAIALTLLPSEQIKMQLSPDKLAELLAYGFDLGTVFCETDHSQARDLRIPISSGRLRE